MHLNGFEESQSQSVANRLDCREDSKQPFNISATIDRSVLRSDPVSPAQRQCRMQQETRTSSLPGDLWLGIKALSATQSSECRHKFFGRGD